MALIGRRKKSNFFDPLRKSDEGFDGFAVMGVILAASSVISGGAAIVLRRAIAGRRS
jgi:hypothetical protein